LPYAYVGGNPVNRVDPSGYFGQDCEHPPYDGFVEGFQVRLGGWLLYAADVLSGIRHWQDIYFTYFGGVEWVFDFEHKEMASFVYVGEVFEPYNLGSGSIAFYDGQIDGFRNYDIGSGVLAYNGPFIGAGNSWGLSYIVGGGTTQSVAYPADEYLTIEKSILDAAKISIHPEKMEASYKGYYFSIGFQGDIGIPTPNLPKLPNWISFGFETSTSIYGNSSLPISADVDKMASTITNGYDFADPIPALFNRRYSWWMLPVSKNRAAAVQVLKRYFSN